ncbi:hypothetical protein [Synechococcus sp. PCC 7336]|uniref:hypothetical protein n=1 Tax=Synechococcus sp. PCC 7336 TaxID=195250 RepID=UPI000349A862|nr:hypothetical protein [Synechococcus sp. PCC 7336]
MRLLESCREAANRSRSHLSVTPLRHMAIAIAAATVSLGWSTSAAQVLADVEPPSASPVLFAQAEEIPDPQQFRALEQAGSNLSFRRAELLLEQANTATDAQNFARAAELLEETFNAFNTRSNYYQELSRSFAGIDNRISDSLRGLAREAAQSRDEVAFELAIVYRADNKAEEAVAQLVQVISSQGPTRDLGVRAYNQLFELGFVDTPYDNPFSSPN